MGVGNLHPGKRWNSLAASARRKISNNRNEQRRIGRGPAQLQQMSELEECVAALVATQSFGHHPWSCGTLPCVMSPSTGGAKGGHTLTCLCTSNSANTVGGAHHHGR